MTQEARERYLRIALIAIGCIFIVGVLPLMMLWPAGWRWEPHQAEYEQMILGVYATLGIFLLRASRAPDRNRSLILFAGWSSLVHSGIMAIQALRETTERGHLFGDVPALAFAGVVLLVLAPADVHVRRDKSGNP